MAADYATVVTCLVVGEFGLRCIVTVVPSLKDPTYAGRGGGYITRITGKLLYEVATGGQRQVFLPAPNTGAQCRIYKWPGRQRVATLRRAGRVL